MERVSEKYASLFQQITVGKLEVRNRIAMAPMCTFMTTHDGYVDNQTKAWFAARAKGGTSLIVSSPVVANPKGAEANADLNLRLYNDSHRKGMSELAEIVHIFDAKFVIMVGSGGGRQRGSDAPSPVPIEYHPELMPDKVVKAHKERGLHFYNAEVLQKLHGVIPSVITVEKIVEHEDNCANVTLMARQCGIDGVEFHHGHGHLGHQFLSPRTNKRTDMYGGSFENRTRFLMNMLIKARKKVGRDFCIGIRISGEEHMPGGLTNDDVVKVCQQAEELIDYVSLTDGCYEAFKYFLPDEDGTMLQYAENLKKVLKIPIMTPSIHNPEMAAQAVAEGKTDMVAHGRPLIADPAWANKVAQGKSPVKCIRCGIGCLRFRGEKTPLRCMVNPEAGLEEYILEYQPSRPFKKHWYHE